MAYCPNCGCIYDETEETRCPYCDGGKSDSDYEKRLEKEYQKRERERQRREGK